jgi:hypothetical protein
MVEMKVGESLLYPSFFSEKTAKLTLLTHCISIGRRAIGLPLAGLDKGMSQHYSAQDQARSLLDTEAGLEIKMKKDEKSILFVFALGTTRCELQLSIRSYGDYELITYYLEI